MNKDVSSIKHCLIFHADHLLSDLNFQWPLKSKSQIVIFLCCRIVTMFNGVARMLKKLHTSTGDYWIKQRFFSIASLFKMRTSLIEKNLLPEGANFFLLEQFLMV